MERPKQFSGDEMDIRMFLGHCAAPSSDRVKRLKEHLAMSKTKHEERILELASLKDAHVYCVLHGLSAQQYGPLLERFIRARFGFAKNRAEDCTGDARKDGQNSEIKVSLGGATHTKYNYVQIRPSHACENYILTAYHLSAENVEDEGELFVFRVPKAELKKLVIAYGGYAHGTLKEHGTITEESLEDANREYALRPTIHDACWKALLAHRIAEDEL